MDKNTINYHKRPGTITLSQNLYALTLVSPLIYLIYHFRENWYMLRFFWFIPMTIYSIIYLHFLSNSKKRNLQLSIDSHYLTFHNLKKTPSSVKIPLTSITDIKFYGFPGQKFDNKIREKIKALPRTWNYLIIRTKNNEKFKIDGTEVFLLAVEKMFLKNNLKVKYGINYQIYLIILILSLLGMIVYYINIAPYTMAL